MIANSRNVVEGDPQVLDQLFGTELSQRRRNPSKQGPSFYGTQEVPTTQPPRQSFGVPSQGGEGRLARVEKDRWQRWLAQAVLSLPAYALYR